MSRGKVRTASEVCADCNLPDPSWASINRGVLICDECCSVHRSLGRHVSQVKSLKKAQWSPTLLEMVHQLANHGANNIWEHSLLDPSQNKHGRRKPNPRDQVHPTKADFIRAKYQFLAFINKHKDVDSGNIEDLSKQLHSSVRTNNLETCLRLLSKGADPNYYHQEKGNCPLHVAAQAGQITQVELLVIYGADPGAIESNGKTTLDYAKAEGHMDICDRLVECQYELTDRLAYYLCDRKPDHRNGQNFIIPEMADSSLDLSELAKQAKKKLQALPNHLFEELAMDVYDEVDRRENDGVWLATSDHTSIVSDRQAIPFLPVNPEFSATRNQGRQKLARFNAREFATLIIDILSDAKRRQLGISSPVQTPKDLVESLVALRKLTLSDQLHELRFECTPVSQSSEFRVSARDMTAITNPRNDFVFTDTRNVRTISTVSDDEPIYDVVASDEDYSSIDTQSIHSVKEEVKHDQPADDCLIKRETLTASVVSFTDDMNESMTSEQVDGPVSVEDFLALKRSLTASEARSQQLMQLNKDHRQEVLALNSVIARLMEENKSLRRNLDQREEPASHRIPNGHNHLNLSHAKHQPQKSPSPEQEDVTLRVIRSGIRPQSMIEPRTQLKRQQQAHSKDDSMMSTSANPINIPELEENSLEMEKKSLLQMQDGDSQEMVPRTDCENAQYTEANNSQRQSDEALDRLQDSWHSSIPSSPDSIMSPLSEGEIEEGFPKQQEVVKKTERITKKIQELLVSAKAGKRDSFGACSEKIHSAVSDMAALFPKKPRSDRIRGALHLLTSSADHLRAESRQTQTDSADEAAQQVIHYAYDIAKAAKQLVTLFE